MYNFQAVKKRIQKIQSTKEKKKIKSERRYKK